jgi:hypothetical protein
MSADHHGHSQGISTACAGRDEGVAELADRVGSECETDEGQGEGCRARWAARGLRLLANHRGKRWKTPPLQWYGRKLP